MEEVMEPGSGPNQTLSDDEVAKIVSLACLDPAHEDIAGLTEDFNRIIGYMGKLHRVEVGAAAATSHVHGDVNVLRQDEVLPSLSHEEGLRNAPDRAGPFFRVPLVVEG
jgi:aspartyl-tRNA(Asn)/glutamyl-tRNA(Gln) amidotransferase subunit C